MKHSKRFDDSDFESLLAKVADEYSDRLAEGEQPSVEYYASRYPNIADAIRRVLPALNALDQSASTESVRPAFVRHETLGDYRIKAEIGRGGMGIVYEAEEQSLGRIVALKVLPFTAMLGERQLIRFKNEARAAATLNHPHIVPVYSFGMERGIHYYSMKFIQGQSMAELIHDLRRCAKQPDKASCLANSMISAPIWAASGETAKNVADRTSQASNPNELKSATNGGVTGDSIESADNSTRNATSEFYRNVARLGVQAAEALDHAHHQGVLHRDVKPANMMIDSTAHLWITDFGLARLGDDAGITLTGDLLGTARYMSPEQILAKRVVIDHRADVYSLGVSLYELATLQVAFDGEDRYELWRQISFENPTPPRKIDSHIPAELETIILKAIEKNPNDRYQTAADLADDLQRFLENRPIKAKPASLLGAASKWAQRHQTFVWSAMMVMAIAIGVLGVSIYLINQAYQLAQDQRDRAETHLRLARDVIDETYNDELARLKKNKGTSAKQRDLLERLTVFYERLPKDELKDDSLFHDSVTARLRLGDILAILGKDKLAAKAYQEAVDSAEELCRRSEDRRFHVTRTLATSGLGQAQMRLQQRQQAIRTHQKANRQIDRLLKEYPDDLAIQRLAAEKIYLPIAMHDTRQREFVFRQTIAELGALAERFPNETAFPDAMARAQDHLGVVLRSIGRISEAQRLIEEAADVQRQLSERNLDEPTFVYDQANTLGHLSLLMRDKGNRQQALATLRKSIELLETLTSQYPDRSDYQAALAQSHNDLGVLLLDNRESQLAAAEFEKAIAILRPLSQATEAPAHRFSLATNINNLGEVYYRLNDATGARQLQREAMQMWHDLARRYPHDAQYQLSVAVGKVGLAKRYPPNSEDRLNELRSATEIMDQLVRKHPERIEYTARKIRYTTDLANALSDLGMLEEAEQYFNEVIELSESFSKKYPEYSREDEDASHSAARAEISWRLGRLDETIHARQIAIDRYRVLLESQPGNARYKAELATQLKRLGFVYLRQGQFDEAEQACRESIALCRELIDSAPNQLAYQQKLFRRLELLLAIHIRRDDLSSAEQTLQRQIETVDLLTKTLNDSSLSVRDVVGIRVHLANVIDEQAANRIDDASAVLDEAYQICRDAGDGFTALLVRLNQGRILNARQQTDQARPKLLEAISIAEQISSHLTTENVKARETVLRASLMIARELAKVDRQTAERLLRRLIDRAEKHLALRQQQAWGIANWNEPPADLLDRAIAITSEGIQKQPNNGAIWANHGLVRLRAGDPNGAIRSLDKSSSLLGPTIQTQFLLAIAHAKNQNGKMARQQFQQATNDLLLADPFVISELRQLRDEAGHAVEIYEQAPSEIIDEDKP